MTMFGKRPVEVSALRRLCGLGFILLLGACASGGGSTRFRELTPKSGASVIEDPAPFEDVPGALPFTDEKQGPHSVAVNVQLGTLGGGSFYFLRLIIGNAGPEELDTYVDVSVLDAAGLRVPSIEREDVLRYAVTLAGGDPSKVNGSTVGTAAGAAAPIASMAGAGPAAHGLGLLALLARAADSPEDHRREGARLAHWALDHWMPSKLKLAAGESQAGILTFHAPRRQPLRIRVKLGEATYEFSSRTEAER